MYLALSTHRARDYPFFAFPVASQLIRACPSFSESLYANYEGGQLLIIQYTPFSLKRNHSSALQESENNR